MIQSSGHKAWWRKWRGLPEPTLRSIRCAEVSREALRILEDSLTFRESVNQDYIDAFKAEPGKTITIRRPQRFSDQKLDIK